MVNPRHIYSKSNPLQSLKHRGRLFLVEHVFADPNHQKLPSTERPAVRWYFGDHKGKAFKCRHYHYDFGGWEALCHKEVNERALILTGWHWVILSIYRSFLIWTRFDNCWQMNGLQKEMVQVDSTAFCKMFTLLTTNPYRSKLRQSSLTHKWVTRL